MKKSIQSEVFQIPSMVRVELSYGHKFLLFLLPPFEKENGSFHAMLCCPAMSVAISVTATGGVCSPLSVSSTVGATFTTKVSVTGYRICHYSTLH